MMRNNASFALRAMVCACSIAAVLPMAAATAAEPYAASVPVPAKAAPVLPAADLGADFWVSVGGGIYSGQDYKAPDRTSSTGDYDSQAHKAGGPEGYVALNYGERFIGRLRGNWMLEYTNNSADEEALEIGFALMPSRVYVLAGVSRLSDVANDRQRPIVGVPLELLFYPIHGRILELGIHGNLNSQSNFIGFTIGGAIGKRRVP